MPYTTTIQAVRLALVEAVSALDAWFEQAEDIRTYKPADHSWSIDEILEHVTLTSHYLLIIIRKGRAKALRRVAQGEQPAEGESDLTRLAPIGHPDAFPWIRPEHMEPTRSVTLAEVRARLHEQYQECLEILSALDHGEG